jgi:hypothetical protein
MRSLAFVIAFLMAMSTASAQFEIILQFSEMTPHLGQQLGIRVTERSTGKEAARYLMQSIKTADFEVRLLCGRSDVDYNVDFYADLNKNGKYDPPPADHAWRELVGIINNHAVVEFKHNLNFTDIMWPKKADPLPSIVKRVYEGNWHNNTFDTDGTASAVFNLHYGSSPSTGSITIDGAFGSPTPITINGSGRYFAASDSLPLAVQAPLAGVIFFVRGEVAGVVMHPTLGVNITLSGNYGDDQLMMTYEMAGSFEADGIMTLQTTEVTGVDEPDSDGVAGRLSIAPNPAQDEISIDWNEEDGEPLSLKIIDPTGKTVIQPRVEETSEGHARIDVRSLPSGSYVFVLKLEHKTVSSSLIIAR